MANQGAAPVALGSDVGKVRTLLGDTDAKNIVSGVGEYLWYSDAEIEALLTLKGSAERTAIYIWRLIAMTPALQLKKWSSADLMVDGPAITRAIRDIINDIEAGLILAEAAGVSDYHAIVHEPNGTTVDALLSNGGLEDLVPAGGGGVPEEDGWIPDPDYPGYEIEA